MHKPFSLSLPCDNLKYYFEAQRLTFHKSGCTKQEPEADRSDYEKTEIVISAIGE
jgi:hypothetical protein